MNNPMFLSTEEVSQLTGRRQHASQIRVLRAMGIEHRVRPDGHVMVLRRHVEELFGSRRERQPAPIGEPDWSAA